MTALQLSARNQYEGVVAAVREGAVNGVVTLDLGGTFIKADITMESIAQLGIVEGARAIAVIKATSVMFAPGTERLPITARNQFAGTIVQVSRSALHAHVRLVTPDNLAITGSITCSALDDLGLAEGASALAIVKSTDVMILSASTGASA